MISLKCQPKPPFFLFSKLKSKPIILLTHNIIKNYLNLHGYYFKYYYYKLLFQLSNTDKLTTVLIK